MKKTEIQVAESENINHEYLPVTGLESFTKASVRLLLGEESAAVKENRAHGVQALSGTGALRLGMLSFSFTAPQFFMPLFYLY